MVCFGPATPYQPRRGRWSDNNDLLNREVGQLYMENEVRAGAGSNAAPSRVGGRGVATST